MGVISIKINNKKSLFFYSNYFISSTQLNTMLYLNNYRCAKIT